MSWWFDKIAVEQTLKLRDRFDVVTYVETGTFRGINLRFHSFNFEEVLGVEKSKEYADKTRQRCSDRTNVTVRCSDSAEFLRSFVAWHLLEPSNIPFFYLDAHFYNPAERWVVKRELQMLCGLPNCIIAIHDFQVGGLGYLIYDGEPLSFAVIRNELDAINPFFSYYTNSPEWSEVHTAESIVGVQGLEPDEDTLETIRYHDTDWRKHRGILYCTPTPLDLQHYKLKCLTYDEI